MSQEDVETFKRGIEAGNRGDWDLVIEGLHPDVEWYPALLTSLAGGATVYRGHDGVREWFRSVAEVLTEGHMEFAEIRDLGDRILALGQYRIRGEVSGAETESPLAYIVDYENGKATRVRSYLDPKEALEAAERPE